MIQAFREVLFIYSNECLIQVFRKNMIIQTSA